MLRKIAFAIALASFFVLETITVASAGGGGSCCMAPIH
jgi:hypothetical protein